jgi:hypothetical protein
LTFEFALEAVSRRADVTRPGIKNGRIRIDRVHNSKPVDIPVTPELQAACEAIPKGHALSMVNQYGKPRSVEASGRAFAERVTEALLPSVPSAFTGSRKAACGD